MIDVLAIFLLAKFEAAWYWWAVYLGAAFVKGWGEIERWNKIEKYLDHAETEYYLRKEDREKNEKHIYLGGMLDE